MTGNSPSAHPNKLGQNKLDQAKKLVIKIGSALLMSDQPGFIRHAWLEVLLQEVAAAQKGGQEVIIVSSGAIALGRRQLGLVQGKLKLEEKASSRLHRPDPPIQPVPGNAGQASDYCLPNFINPGRYRRSAAAFERPQHNQYLAEIRRDPGD